LTKAPILCYFLHIMAGALDERRVIGREARPLSEYTIKDLAGRFRVQLKHPRIIELGEGAMVTIVFPPNESPSFHIRQDDERYKEYPSGSVQVVPVEGGTALIYPGPHDSRERIDVRDGGVDVIKHKGGRR